MLIPSTIYLEIKIMSTKVNLKMKILYTVYLHMANEKGQQTCAAKTVDCKRKPIHIHNVVTIYLPI